MLSKRISSKLACTPWPKLGDSTAGPAFVRRAQCVLGVVLAVTVGACQCVCMCACVRVCACACVRVRM